MDLKRKTGVMKTNLRNTCVKGYGGDGQKASLKVAFGLSPVLVTRQVVRFLTSSHQSLCCWRVRTCNRPAGL
jgi:hypothetical protein